MKKQKECTTVMVYREDLAILNDMCKKGENFRDKIHEILKKVKK